jgi:hypothetical protein
MEVNPAACDAPENMHNEDSITNTAELRLTKLRVIMFSSCLLKLNNRHARNACCTGR